MGNSPDQLACIESNSIKVLEIGDMDNLKGLDPVIFYSMSKLVSLKLSFWCLNSGKQQQMTNSRAAILNLG